MRNLLLLLLVITMAGQLSAQELNVDVTINAARLQLVDPSVFKTLEQTVSEFMNTTKWTDDIFEPEERINVNLILTVKEERSPTEFAVDMAIQASRPVYNSTYTTSLFNHLEQNVDFTYEQYQPLQISFNRFNDNLSHVLAFYAYTILGLDYDSYSPFGGEAYFRQAQELVNSVPTNTPHKGWQGKDSNFNRFWLQENYLSPRMRPLRQAWYDYHRQALDFMADDPDAARAVMVTALEKANSANRAYPNSNAILAFVNAKSREIIEIFKQATPQEQSSVVAIMSAIDRSNIAKYRAIR